MEQKADRVQAPPLSSWLLTAVFAAAGLVTLVLIGRSPLTPPSEAFRLYNEPRVEAFTSRGNDGPYRVLLLGNSRLKYATWDQSDLASLTKGAPDTRILRLVNDWAVFSDFEPLMDTILEHAPDLVVIQLELMSQERSSTANVRFLRLYLKWLLFGSTGEIWNPGDMDQPALQFDTPCAGISPTPRAVEERMNRTFEWLTHDPNGTSSTAARRFVEALRQRGVEVVFLSIPRSVAMESARPEAVLTAGSLSEDEHAGIWRYPHPVSDEDFCDTIHFGDAGRRPFTAWITDEILRARPASDEGAIASISPQ